jgi:amidohydrolase
MKISTTLIKKKIDSIYPDVVNIRRKIHATPELGFAEFKTAKLITETLKALDYEVFGNIAKTGVVACLKGKENAPALAFRADMDALPIQEENNFSYASKIPGVMHACGHDFHVSILLGLAMVFAEFKDQIQSQVVLIFQPAEEGPGGAKPIIESGILKKFNIKAIFGLHVLPNLKSGQVSFKAGPITATIDNFILTIKGKSAHGARPENGIDAILVACQIVNNLQSIISRHIAAKELAVLTIGKIKGGYRRNVIADNVRLEGTVRCMGPETRSIIEDRFKKIIKGVTQAYGADYKLEYTYGYPSAINNNETTDLVKKVSQEVVGKENAICLNDPNLWGEDFAYFLQQYPGTFFHLGGAVTGQKTADLHSPHFVFDENAMKIGIEIFVNLCLEYTF